MVKNKNKILNYGVKVPQKRTYLKETIIKGLKWSVFKKKKLRWLTMKNTMLFGETITQNKFTIHR